MIAEQPLTPWIVFVLALLLLRSTQRWLERHMVGLGLLLTGQINAAYMFYYVVMLPGVLVHELSHWLMAGALNVPTARLVVWPEQTETSVRLGYVETEKPDALRGTLIGVAPFFAGLGIVLLLTHHLLDLPAFAAALSTADMGHIIPAAERLLRTPDFWIWLYLMFTVANSMMPSAADRQHWPVFLAGVVVVGILLAASGFEAEVWEALGGPVAEALGTIGAAFMPILVLNLFAIAVMWAVEKLVGSFTGRRVAYTLSEPAASADTSPPIRSLLDAHLPVPSPPGGTKPAENLEPPPLNLDALPEAPEEFE